MVIGSTETNFNNLKHITKRAANIINIDYFCLPNLKERRLKAATKLFFHAEINNTHILHDIIPRRLPRSNKQHIDFVNTSKIQNSSMALHLNDN